MHARPPLPRRGPPLTHPPTRTPLQCWDRINSAQRGLSTLRAQQKLHGVEVDNVGLVPPVLRAFHARRAEMASFVTSLQYYIAFEVLEPNWTKLTAALPRAADLDGVIALHEGTLQVRCVCAFVRACGERAARRLGAPLKAVHAGREAGTGCPCQSCLCPCCLEDIVRACKPGWCNLAETLGA